jgi:hypothetical protein
MAGSRVNFSASLIRWILVIFVGLLAFSVAMLSDRSFGLFSLCHSSPKNLLLPTAPRNFNPSGVPRKFDTHGNVQPFRGNTIISTLPHETGLYESLLLLHNQLKESHLNHLYALLPPPSWHMTIFDGVVEKKRKTGYWPSNLDRSASLEECTALFQSELSSFNLNVSLPFRLSVDGYSEFGLGLHIEPSGQDNKALRNLRDRLADTLKIRHPNHEVLSLHITIAYFLKHPTEKEKFEIVRIAMDHYRVLPKQFELRAPEFCSFENMHVFKPLLTLRNR